MLKCLKAKIESLGFPDDCATNELKQTYIDNQNAMYHFESPLEVASVVKNASICTLAKTTINSFWGRWGMNTNKGEMVIMSDYIELLKLHNNPNIILGQVIDITPKSFMVTYQFEDEDAPIQGNLSLAIAIFTTCYARLHLYEQALEKLRPEQILYYDTDSVIWVQKQGWGTLEMGEKVGQFKDELSDKYGSGSYISKFFCRGPKSYGYEIVNIDGIKIDSTCLAKGVNFSSRSREVFNPEAMLAAVQAFDGRKILIINPCKICRNKATATLYNREEIKQWSVVYTKHMFLGPAENYSTLPFGYYEANVVNID